MPSGNRVRWHGRNVEMLLAAVGRKLIIQSSNRVEAARNVEGNKKEFFQVW